jgi:hypothetical protein
MNLNTELLSSIFSLCILPLLAILTRYIVTWLEAKSAAIKTNTDNLTA